MITLFEGYAAGVIAGMLSSLKNTRYWALSFFYAVVIVSAHFYLVGPPDYPMPKLLGQGFYFGAGAAQLMVLGASLAIWTPASAPLALLAYVAVVTNGLGFSGYPTHYGIWPYYFAIINTVQTLQIVSLVVLSPLGVYLYHLSVGRISIRKDSAWLSRSQI